MKRDILTYPDERLCLIAPPVEEITPRIRELAADMAETMYADRGIGLAAPQIGECLRMITVDVSGPDERSDLITVVNPRIVAASGAVASEEGCLSVRNYRSVVDRHEKVTLCGLDLDGGEITLEADGIKAICIQHEIDHLEGVLFIDRISRLKRTLYDKRMLKWLRRHPGEES